MNKKFMGDYQQPEVGAGAKIPPLTGKPKFHVLGEFKNGEQRCSVCGLILAQGKKAIAPPGAKVTTEGSKVLLGAAADAEPCRT